MSEEYNEPPVEFSKKEYLLIGLMSIFLFIEWKYMDVWCHWFTNCR